LKQNSCLGSCLLGAVAKDFFSNSNAAKIWGLFMSQLTWAAVEPEQLGAPRSPRMEILKQHSKVAGQYKVKKA
jgi:hypothetical protein